MKKYIIGSLKIAIGLSIYLCITLISCQSNESTENLIDAAAWKTAVFDVPKDTPYHPVIVSFNADSTVINLYQPKPGDHINQAVYQKVTIPASGEYNIDMNLSKDTIGDKKFWFGVFINTVPPEMKDNARNLIWSIENCNVTSGKPLDNVKFSEYACDGKGNPVTLKAGEAYVVIKFGSWTDIGTMGKLKVSDVSLRRVQ